MSNKFKGDRFENTWDEFLAENDAIERIKSKQIEQPPQGVKNNGNSSSR